MKPALLLLCAVLAGACAPAGPRTVEITIHYSHFTPAEIDVPAGVPITFTIRNDDPIDHEWLIGDRAMHERHRTGTEPVHAARPDELTVPARSTRTTTLTFPIATTLQYMCHLPGHEQYGMVGLLVAKWKTRTKDEDEQGVGRHPRRWNSEAAGFRPTLPGVPSAQGPGSTRTEARRLALTHARANARSC